jgi:hypothetical protein
MARRKGLSINHQPPSTERVHTKYSNDELKEFSIKAKRIKPEDR